MHSIPLTDDHLKFLDCLKSLKSLRIYQSQITGTSLESCNVHTLFIDESPVNRAGLAAIAKLKSLRVFRLDRSKIAPTDLSLLSTSQIENIRFPFPTDADTWLSTLCSIRSLKELNLQYNSVSSKVLPLIANLEELEELRLPSKTKEDRKVTFSDADVAFLRRLPKLRKLSAATCNITGVIFASNFPHLEELRLQGCPITPSGLMAISGLPNLRYVNLAGTKLTGPMVSNLTSCKQLTSLIIPNTPVDESCVNSLASMKKLRQLDLRSTSISLESIWRLKRSLPGCIVSPDPDTIARLQSCWWISNHLWTAAE